LYHTTFHFLSKDGNNKRKIICYVETIKPDAAKNNLAVSQTAHNKVYAEAAYF
jgi:AAA15 family ATPase/GTPase